MDDQLHTAGIVEKALGDHAAAGGHHAQDAASFFYVGDQLAAGFGVDAGLGVDPGLGVFRVAKSFGHTFPEARNVVGKLAGPTGGLTQPEGNGGRLALGVLDADAAAFDSADFPGGVAEQKHVASHAFYCKVLVDRANKGLVGLCYDIVVGVVRNGASAGHGGNCAPRRAFNRWFTPSRCSNAPLPPNREANPEERTSTIWSNLSLGRSRYG